MSERRISAAALVAAISLIPLLAVQTQAQSVPIDWSLVQSTAPTTNYQRDIGPCVCDLSYNACDANCCCDTDCSASDISNYFTISCAGVTTSTYSSPLVPYCSSFLYTVNRADSIGVTTSTNAQNAVCVVKTNNPLLGSYYSNNQFYTSDAAFLSAQSQAAGSSQVYSVAYDADAQIVQPQTAYSAGTAVQMAYPNLNNAWGFLRIPQATTSGMCNDAAAALFMVPQSSSCVHTSGTTCAAGSVFDANYWIQGIRVVQNPGTSPTTAVTATVAQPLQLAASGTNPAFVCHDGSGNLVPCSNAGSSSDFSAYVSNIDAPTLPVPTSPASVCLNAVVGVAVAIKYSETSSAVTSVVYTFVFGSIATSQLGVTQQTFNATYLPDTASYNVEKSGNPGYLLGMPVLFGAATTNAGLSAVQFNMDPLQGLSLARDLYDSTVGGNAGMTCVANADTAHRLPITFGASSSTGCTLWYSYNDLTNNCNAIRTRVAAAQLGPNFASINRVGIFGNASWLQSADWLAIMNPTPSTTLTTDTTTPQNGLCSSLLTDFSVQFLWAEFGSVANPQPGIVGVRLAYTSGTFRYSCDGTVGAAACQAASTTTAQPFRIRSTVSWVQVGSTAAQYIPPAPLLISAIPNDVFYPFRVSSGSLGSIRGAQSFWFAAGFGVLAAFMLL